MKKGSILLVVLAVLAILAAAARFTLFSQSGDSAAGKEASADAVSRLYSTDPDAIQATKLIQHVPLHKLTKDQMSLVMRLTNGEEAKKALARGIIGFTEDPAALTQLLPTAITLAKTDPTKSFANRLLSSWKKAEATAKYNKDNKSAQQYAQLVKAMQPYHVKD